MCVYRQWYAFVCQDSRTPDILFIITMRVRERTTHINQYYNILMPFIIGIYQNVYTTINGKHAVKIIGWGIEEGVHYWLCVNSWNAEWGDNGYFKILRGNDECGIETEINAGRMKVD